MAMPRKPLEQRILDGTYKPSKHGPVTAADLPEPMPPKPKYLTEAESVAWDRLALVLVGVVKKRDVPTLVELCRWLARADKLAAQLDGMTLTAKGYPRLFTLAAIATDKVLLLSTRFGVSPADRAKLRADLPSGPAKPKVLTRPRTKLDKLGKPK